MYSSSLSLDRSIIIPVVFVYDENGQRLDHVPIGQAATLQEVPTRPAAQKCRKITFTTPVNLSAQSNYSYQIRSDPIKNISTLQPSDCRRFPNFKLQMRQPLKYSPNLHRRRILSPSSYPVYYTVTDDTFAGDQLTC
jgi:hypothetical protein